MPILTTYYNKHKQRIVELNDVTAILENKAWEDFEPIKFTFKSSQEADEVLKDKGYKIIKIIGV